MTAYCQSCRGQRWSASRDYWLSTIVADLGQVRIDELDPQRIIAWASRTPRSPTSQSSILLTFSRVLQVADALWPDAGVPADVARLSLRRLRLAGHIPPKGRRARRVTERELRTIRFHWSARTRVPVAIVDVLVDTCMRSGELARLRWADVDLERRTALIRDRKHPTEKLGNDQEIPLLGRSAELIAAQPRSAQRPFPFPQAGLRSTFRAAAERAGVRNVRLHDLRHEGISRLFEKGWSIPQVAAVSGHRSWDQLKRYTHISAQALLELEGKA